MSRAVLILGPAKVRKQAADWCLQAKPGTSVEFKEPKRSDDQNKKMWACLTDVARQVEWHGQKLPADDWKLLFLDALGREMRIVPALDGHGFVNIGIRSSQLTKAEMADLIELILMFGANHSVIFHEPKPAPARETEKEGAR